ncbi:MAG: hypothetical protein DRR42_19130 [Gammaproteobacteria bacterium]|nr:MAG: hypothetical protein DRR42_19130 [Gammaproteobacteria bacterium]
MELFYNLIRRHGNNSDLSAIEDEKNYFFEEIECLVKVGAIQSAGQGVLLFITTPFRGVVVINRRKLPMKLENLIRELAPECNDDELNAIVKVYRQVISPKVLDNVPADVVGKMRKAQKMLANIGVKGGLI